MQPYFLPYVGYWQLVSAVDKFVLLDDVNYINRGWIARNRIMGSGGKPQWMTLPVQGASQNKLICELDLVPDDGWRSRLSTTVRHSYGKAPFFEAAFPCFEETMAGATGNLSEFLAGSIVRMAKFMGLDTEIIPTSREFPKGNLRGAQRIIDICRRLGASAYINPPGGTDLYDADDFRDADIALYFLRPKLAESSLRSSAEDGAVLSILDTLMYNDRSAVATCLEQDRTIEPNCP